MLYYPENRKIGDTWYYADGDTVHCFFLLQKDVSTDDESASKILGHAVTKDLVNWETLPPALCRGEAGSYDDNDMWTGCALKDNDKHYLYYTALNSQNGVTQIAGAVSSDGKTWEKMKENPLFSPDSRWYCSAEKPLHVSGHATSDFKCVDCRDICLVKNPDESGYTGFFAARVHAKSFADTTVIGLCKTTDMVHFEQLPPCFAPKGLACVEVPDVFEMDGTWYMLFLSGNFYGQRSCFSDPLLSFVTGYATSDKLEGPYEFHPDQLVLKSIHGEGFCSRTVLYHGERVMFYTQRCENPFNRISFPVLLKCDSQKKLHPCWHSAIMNKWQLCTQKNAPLPVTDGNWGSIGSWKVTDSRISGQCENDWAVLPFEKHFEDVMITADLSLEKDAAAGIAMNLQGDNICNKGTAFIFDAKHNLVQFVTLRNFTILEQQNFNFADKPDFSVRVINTDQVYLLYIDDELVIQLYHNRETSGKAALYVEKGAASFCNLKFYQER